MQALWWRCDSSWLIRPRAIVVMVMLVELSAVHAATFYWKDCLDAHNDLRRLHQDTASVEYSSTLEAEAVQLARQLQISDSSTSTGPTRPLPKRKKRAPAMGAVESFTNIELWDGDITYPLVSSSFNLNRAVPLGVSIHKFCCLSHPNCPKQFFHGLDFPPDAASLVRDWYSYEIGNYNFKTGRRLSSFSSVLHFTNVVWRSTRRIGCAQSQMSARNCYYSLVLYEEEGSKGTDEQFLNNVGVLKASQGDTSSSGHTVLIVFMVLLGVTLVAVLVVVCYIKRDSVQSKYMALKIKTDTLKAEAELRQDRNASLWWLYLCYKRPPPRRRSTVSRPRTLPRAEKPSIEVIINPTPRRALSPKSTTPVSGLVSTAPADTCDDIQQPPRVTFADGRGGPPEEAWARKPLPKAPVPALKPASASPPVGPVLPKPTPPQSTPPQSTPPQHTPQASTPPSDGRAVRNSSGPAPLHLPLTNAQLGKKGLARTPSNERPPPPVGKPPALLPATGKPLPPRPLTGTADESASGASPLPSLQPPDVPRVGQPPDVSPSKATPLLPAAERKPPTAAARQAPQPAQRPVSGPAPPTHAKPPPAPRKYTEPLDPDALHKPSASSVNELKTALGHLPADAPAPGKATKRPVLPPKKSESSASPRAVSADYVSSATSDEVDGGEGSGPKSVSKMKKWLEEQQGR